MKKLWVKKVKKVYFLKRENKIVSFLAATKMDTKEAIVAMILSKFRIQIY